MSVLLSLWWFIYGENLPFTPNHFAKNGQIYALEYGVFTRIRKTMGHQFFRPRFEFPNFIEYYRRTWWYSKIIQSSFSFTHFGYGRTGKVYHKIPLDGASACFDFFKGNIQGQFRSILVKFCHFWPILVYFSQF